MSLRPRYSLLTLLIVTVLVAGGVKLWHGPHHVVEERVPGKTLEYTYTRSWNGEKIVDGPSIIRLEKPQSQRYCVAVAYFQQNRRLSFIYLLFQQRKQTGFNSFSDSEVFQKLPISASEQERLRQVVALERRTMDLELGSEMVWIEMLGDFREAEKKVFLDWEAEYKNIQVQP